MKIPKEKRILKRFKRRILRAEYSDDELVMLYPLSFFGYMEVIPLPLPVFSSTKEYVNASNTRKAIAIVARVIQVALYAALIYATVFVIFNGVGNVFIGALAGSLICLLSVSQISVSVSYSIWMLGHFRQESSRKIK